MSPHLGALRFESTIAGKYYYRKGISIDLGRVPAKGECQLWVSNQKGDVDDRELSNVLSFATFAGNQKHAIERSKVAAWLRASGGEFKVKTTKPKKGKWKVSKKLLNTAGDAEFVDLAWNVLWEPGKQKDAHEIVVSAGAEVMATVSIPGRANPEIIIGNLDGENPATWPLRPLKPMTRCEGEDGSTGGSAGYCHDNDFKWLYPMLRGSYSGSGYAPVPRAEIVASTSPGLSVPVALDTPTCFPGGD